MNICLFGQFPPHIGGVSSHTYMLARELTKRGDKVYVLTYPHGDIKDLDGISVESAFTFNIKGLRGLFFFMSASFKLFSMVRRYDVDIIHAHFLIPPGLIAVLVGRLTGRKVAVTVHGSDIFIQAANPILRRLIKYTLKRADIIAAVDETIGEKILELKIEGANRNIKITPNAVDLEKYNPQNRSSLPQEIGLKPQKQVM